MAAQIATVLRSLFVAAQSELQAKSLLFAIHAGHSAASWNATQNDC